MSTMLPAMVSLGIRTCVGRWGYSGENDSPMFGDFEAQRHWMEITTSLPIGDWYRQTADNDLQYWGLDYPPLTAYVSWIYGVLASYIYPNMVQLHTSRGFENSCGKVFMRSTVLIADILIFIPAFIYSLELLLIKSKVNFRSERKWKSTYLLLLLACLSSPSTILVDHGHFQYNGVCIGLSLWAIVAICHDKDVAGSVLFCLALNFKQMALYYAPVFFFILLRKCIEKETYIKQFLHLFKIGMSVIITFVVLWWPFCVYAAESETCVSSLLHVLSRQFPFSRGIFEDKVANIWYCLSILCDFRQIFSIVQMARLSLCLTLVLIAPIGYDLLRKKNTPIRIILALLNCSMAFFLASFQVHEKSLLLPLIPALLLLHNRPQFMFWFQVLGVFTMFPLLSRDGLRIPYYAMIPAFGSFFILYLEAKKLDCEIDTIVSKISDLKAKGTDTITLKHSLKPLTLIEGDDAKSPTGVILNEGIKKRQKMQSDLVYNEVRHITKSNLLQEQLKITRQKTDLLKQFPVLYGTFDKNETQLSMLYEEKRILDGIMKNLEEHHRYLLDMQKMNTKRDDMLEIAIKIEEMKSDKNTEVTAGSSVNGLSEKVGNKEDKGLKNCKKETEIGEGEVESMGGSGSVESGDLKAKVLGMLENCQGDPTVEGCIPTISTSCAQIVNEGAMRKTDSKEEGYHGIDDEEGNAVLFQEELPMNLKVELSIVILSYLGMIILHVMEAFIRPPDRYPDLYPALFSLFGAVNLFVIYCCGVYWQWNR